MIHSVFVSLTFFFSISLSCACCHGDMTRKQSRSDETEKRGLEVAVIEGSNNQTNSSLV